MLLIGLIIGSIGSLMLLFIISCCITASEGYEIKHDQEQQEKEIRVLRYKIGKQIEQLHNQSNYYLNEITKYKAIYKHEIDRLNNIIKELKGDNK